MFLSGPSNQCWNGAIDHITRAPASTSYTSRAAASPLPPQDICTGDGTMIPFILVRTRPTFPPPLNCAHPYLPCRALLANLSLISCLCPRSGRRLGLPRSSASTSPQRAWSAPAGASPTRGPWVTPPVRVVRHTTPRTRPQQLPRANSSPPVGSKTNSPTHVHFYHHLFLSPCPLPGVRFWKGDAADLPVYQGPFQAAFLNGGFEALRDPHETLARVLLRVAPGGHLVISHPQGRKGVEAKRKANPGVYPNALPTERRARAQPLRCRVETRSDAGLLLWRDRAHVAASLPPRVALAHGGHGAPSSPTRHSEFKALVRDLPVRTVRFEDGEKYLAVLKARTR